MTGTRDTSWLFAARGAVVALAVCLAPSVALGDTLLNGPPEEELQAAPEEEYQAAPEAEAAEPPPVEGLLDRLGQAGDETEAQQIERVIVQTWRQSGSPTVDLLLQRAAGAIEDEEFGLALEFLDSIVELAPDFAEGWNMRATVYYRINEYQLSINDLGRTLALQPRHFGALSGLGIIFNRLDDDERALHALRQALEVHPHLGNNIRDLVERLEIEVEGRGI